MYKDEFKTVSFLTTFNGTISFKNNNINKKVGQNAKFDSLSLNCTNEPITYNIHNFKSEDVNAYFEGTQLNFIEKIVLAPDEIIKFQAGTHVFSIEDNKTRERYLRVSMNISNSNLIWEFDLHRNLSISANCNDDRASRMEFFIKMFELFPSEKNVKPLMCFTESQYHFVRWKAVKALIIHDKQKGIEALHQAKNDKHIHVKTAATKTLQNLKDNDFM